jgi:ribosomal protein S18 acetylase RimI-like enzyme
MAIIPATPHHLPQIRQLLANGRRVYQNFGGEDLTALLTTGHGVVGEEQGRLWGFATIGREARAPTFPPTAPERAQVRALALANGHPPAEAGVALLRATVATVQNPTLVIVYGGEPWLTDVLPTAGFVRAEEVQYYHHNQVQRYQPRRQPTPAAQLRPMQPTDVEPVAQLDAAAFDLLWHFPAKSLWELLFQSRMQVAVQGANIVGYSAVALNQRVAHLARLAVHPSAQSQGIGRQLLDDVLVYAATNRAHTVTLNTQVSNVRSQQLYGAFGFQATRQIVLVFTRLVQP